MSKKVYISMAKSGMTLKEVHDKQDRLIGAIEQIIGEPIELLYPTVTEKIDGRPLSLLLENLTLMNRADYIAFLEGWTNEHESRLEHEIAVMYRLPYVEVNEEAAGMLTIKVYVSTAREGKSEADLEAEYHEVSREVYEKLKGTIPIGGVKVVNAPIGEGLSPLEELHERLRQMNDADYVVFKESSENERSGYIERKCAEEYGLPYYEESELKD